MLKCMLHAYDCEFAFQNLIKTFASNVHFKVFKLLLIM